MAARRTPSSSKSCLSLMRAITLVGFAISTSTIDASIAAPAKKTTRKSQPVAPTHTSPDVTATIPKDGTPKKAGPTPVDKDNDDGVVPPAFNLPTASRARMRTCSEDWQALKMSGKVGDQTWRAYATKCLVSKDASADDKTKARSP